MSAENHLRTLRGTPAAIGKILEVYQAHSPEAGHRERVLEALDALETQATHAEMVLMDDIFNRLDEARARISGTGSARGESKTGENIRLNLPNSAHRGRE